MKAIFFVGLDVHVKHTNVCILDQRGNLVQQLKVRGPWADIAQVLRELPGKVRVCFEASCGYGHLYELLSTPASSWMDATPPFQGKAGGSVVAAVP